MICLLCRHGETRPGSTTATFHRDAHTIVVTDVPADVCDNCGEPYIAEATTAQLLAQAVDARRAGITVLVGPYLESELRGLR